ncbi:galactokinase [Parelusimicrobium proximum]|uniref:galactokinase n=1 Tax=Parelusimicrobium proximum TaxID=3228953 RepID=UPI003D169828
MKQEIGQIFERIFNKKAQQFFFAPGRVNLIGEHIDYNGGHVFPCAITFGTYAAVSQRKDKIVNFYSENFADKGIVSINLDEPIVFDKKHDWANYPKGVLNVLMKRGYKIPSGFDIAFIGDIPQGTGLSSSASIEVTTAVTMSTIFDMGIELTDLALISQEAENKFIGLNSGIMDQFASAMGKKDNAMLLDCLSLKYEYVPLVLKSDSIVIANTNKSRELASSKYNERRAQCEEALKDLQTKLDIKDLCSLTPQQFEENKDLIKDPIVRKRAKHAVYENDRTLRAVGCLNVNDIAEFGRLMAESHKSLRDDYEVTGPELDAIVEAAWEESGCIAARMTGGGFGGCAVCIVENDRIEDFKKHVAEKYTKKTGLTPDFYIATPGKGAGEI